MADFFLTTNSSTARLLSGSESGFIGPNGGLNVSGTDAITASFGTNWLTVLGYVNAYDGGFAAVDADGSVFEMTVGRDGYLTAENPSGGVLDINLSSTFNLYNEGTIHSNNDRAVEVDDTDGSVNVNINNAGRIQSFNGETIYVNAGTGDIEFINTGEITGTGPAVRLFRDTGASSTTSYYNSGTVMSVESDGFLIDQGIGSAGFVNTGTIIGEDDGVDFNDSGSVEFTNTGTIQGNNLALEFEGGNDYVYNRGTLIGGVSLGAGNDTIDTREGTVVGTISGGSDNDVFIVDDATISLSEAFNGGNDRVESSVSFRLFDSDIENLILTGQTAVRGVGNSGSNEITGNDAANEIFGFAGADILYGGLGNDKIFGSSGEDEMGGDAGNDWLHGGADDDELDGGEGDDTLDGGTGDDFITATQGANVVDGGTGNDTIYAATSYVATPNFDGQTIDGGKGDDLVRSGAGADTMDGGEGTDTLDYSISAERVVVNLGVGFFSGGYAEGDRATNFENLTGGSGNDVLVGTSGANLITSVMGENEMRGEDGEDTLVSGSGADTLNGGDGADTADYSQSSSRIILNLETGFRSGGNAAGDTLISIERVVGTDFNDKIVGTSGGNRLFGGDDNDELNGAGGGDLLYGGLDDDILIGGTGADQFIIEDAYGNDTINDFEDGVDLINMRLLSGVSDIGDVNVTISGSDLVIDTGGADSITLLNANGSATITSADFLFA